MSLVTALGEKKPCVLEMADASPAPRTEATHDPRPCALLCADVPGENGAPAAPKAPPAPPPEDESADPVGDGHSDAEWAERHPKG